MARHGKKDPTGQAKNRRRAFRKLEARLKSAEKKIQDTVAAIPSRVERQVKVVNAQTEEIYIYDLNEQNEEALRQAITYTLNAELLETQGEAMPMGWYWQKEIEQPYRQGTLETARDQNRNIEAAALAGYLARGMRPQPVDQAQILFSETYRNNIQRQYKASFAELKGLSADTSKQISRQVIDGIHAGKSPEELSAAITDRVNVSKSRADGIAQTEINKAYTDAAMDATIQIADVTGLRAGVIHVSALLPTTREHHAARHGNAYTVEDQRQWWDEGANRIRCHCSVISVLIDDNGRVVESKTRDKIQAEREFFD